MFSLLSFQRFNLPKDTWIVSLLSFIFQRRIKQQLLREIVCQVRHESKATGSYKCVSCMALDFNFQFILCF